MKKLIIKSNHIYTSSGEKKGYILIDDKHIKEISKNIDEIKDYKCLEANDYYVIPGFIDIHIHGAGGFSASTKDVNEIHLLSQYLAKNGITGFLPTIGNGHKDNIISNIKTICKAMGNEPGAKILGIHMEGPFLNPDMHGAFNEEDLIKPNIEIMKEFIDASEGNISRVSLAPELDGSKELIEYLVKQQIVVAGAHTNASFKETVKGIDWGISLSNHTGNAQNGIHHREPGAFGGYLIDERVNCEVIGDFLHVHPEILKLIIKIKTSNKTCFISDSMPAAGLKPGEYTFMGNKVEIDEKGFCTYKDGTMAGSSAKMNQIFKNLIKLGCSFEDSVMMSSSNPALFSKIPFRGKLEEGMYADIIVLDRDMNIITTIVEGKTIV